MVHVARHEVGFCRSLYISSYYLNRQAFSASFYHPPALRKASVCSFRLLTPPFSAHRGRGPTHLRSRRVQGRLSDSCPDAKSVLPLHFSWERFKKKSITWLQARSSPVMVLGRHSKLNNHERPAALALVPNKLQVGSNGTPSTARLATQPTPRCPVSDHVGKEGTWPMEQFDRLLCSRSSRQAFFLSVSRCTKSNSYRNARCRGLTSA